MNIKTVYEDLAEIAIYEINFDALFSCFYNAQRHAYWLYKNTENEYFFQDLYAINVCITYISEMCIQKEEWIKKGIVLKKMNEMYDLIHNQIHCEELLDVLESSLQYYDIEKLERGIQLSQITMADIEEYGKSLLRDKKAKVENLNNDKE